MSLACHVSCDASWLFRIVERECCRLKRALRRLVLQPELDEMDGPTTRPRTASCATYPMHWRACPRITAGSCCCANLEGRSIAGIAEHLGLHVEAEKARLHHARLLAREYRSSDAADAPSKVHATG